MVGRHQQESPVLLRERLFGASLPFSLDLTSSGNPGVACPPPCSQAGILFVQLWGSQVHAKSPRVDRVGSEGKRDPCPGWVTLTPAKVPEPQSCDSLSF